MQSGGNRSHTDTESSNQQDFRRARVLVVEDQADVRQLLVTALEIEGHEVDEASNAIEGLQKIRQNRYNLILTDYAMPGGTGTWMLQQASADDLLQGTVSLVVTAHPDARELSTHDVIPKPLDLDNFLGQVRRVLAASNRLNGGPGSADDAGSGRRARFIVELVLYVSSASPASIQARRNLEQVLDGFDRSQIKYTICDLGREPMAAEIDRVAFTPTLVKRYPEPRMWLLGTLRETDLVADLLRVCGVDAKA